MRMRQPDVRVCVAPVERDRALEIANRFGHVSWIEGLELETTFGERAVRLEARRLVYADARRSRRGDRDVKAPQQLRHDRVLELEHTGHWTIRLRVRDRLAAVRVDGARRDAQPIAGPLVAADDQQIEPGGPGRFDRRVARSVRDARPI